MKFPFFLTTPPILFFVPMLNMPITWYGVLFGTGYTSFCFLLKFFAKIFIDRSTMCDKVKKSVLEWLMKLDYVILVSSIIGARLGEVFVYNWQEYNGDLLSALKVWHGGLSGHFGVSACLVSISILTMCKFGRLGVRFLLPTLLVVALACGPWFALIRIGNFLNQEIIGTVSTSKYSVVFTRVDSLPRHPVQLYEATIYILLWIIFMKLFMLECKIESGLLLGSYVLLISISRMCIEIFKESTGDVFHGMKMGQLLSAIFCVYGLYHILRSPFRIRYLEK